MLMAATACENADAIMFSQYPAPRYAFRRGVSVSTPDSPIWTAGVLQAWVLQALAWDSSKGLPPVLLQAVEQKGAAFAVFGGQPGKGADHRSNPAI